MSILSLDEQRCKCGKLLLKGVFFDGTVEIKCRKCGTINSFGYSKSIDNAKNYLLIFGDKGTVINASDSACHVLGYSKNELIGKHFTQINTKMPLEVSKKFVGAESILKKENNLKIDTFHRNKDESLIPVTMHLKLHYCPGEERSVLASVRVRNSGEPIKYSEKDGCKFLSNCCDFCFEVDKNGMLEYASDSILKFLGTKPEKLIGTAYLDLISDKAREAHRKRFAFFSQDAQPYKIEYTCKNGDKSTDTELYFTPKFDDMGNFIGYCTLGWVVKKI